MNRLVFIIIGSFLLSGYTYTISQDTGDFKIIYPRQDIRVEKGETLNIKWLNYSYSARNISRLKIELCKDKKTVATLAERIINNGYYEAKIPDNIQQGKYQIKITSINAEACVFSETFYIIPPIPITIITPDKDTTWKKGKTYTIQWKTKTPQQEAKVYINLFRQQEDKRLTSLAKIADNVNNTGELKFSVPTDLPDGTYVLGIRLTTISEIKYSSPFKIKGED